MAQALTAQRVSGWHVVLLLAFVTIAARAQTFGNPVIGFDEQFYLLVGDRMVHGAIPYVDIFDRKPIGLFLIYAGIRALGGEGTIQYQLVAALFVLATALLIHRFARRIAPPAGAIAAAIAYVLWLNFMEGEGGQAPVFYNLPMIGAAMLAARVWQSGGQGVAGRGSAAMLLTGIAMQIKYTAVFEGVFFGVALVWAGWHAGVRVKLAGLALLWVTLSLLPTAFAFAAYAAMGHAHEFLFANFVSTFGKLPDPIGTSAIGLATIIGILAPFLILAALGRGDQGAVSDRRFVHLWLASALAGMLAFASFASPHYGLPVLVPAVIAAAPVLGRWRSLRWGLLALGFGGGQAALAATAAAKGGRAEAFAIAAAATPRHGCLYVYDGYPALYRLTHSCLPTRFAFPGHLNTANEASEAGLGINPSAEVERIMASRPDTVVDDWPVFERGNPATRAIVRRYLARDYHLILRQPTGSHRVRLVYRLKVQGSISTGRM